MLVGSKPKPPPSIVSMRWMVSLHRTRWRINYGHHDKRLLPLIFTRASTSRRRTGPSLSKFPVSSIRERH